MMLYKLFVKGLLTGSFALHSAKLNNHNILKINTLSLGHKVYECIKKDTFLAKFGLEKWFHEEKILILSDTEVEITDILKWTNCDACRTYTIIDDNGNAKRYTKANWKVNYSGMYPLNNFVAGKIKNTMMTTDLEAFNSFNIEK